MELGPEECQRCGACCTNPLENIQEGTRFYVPIEPGEGILTRRDLVKKLVVLDDDGDPHLRLDGQGRCLALAGALGRRVRCTIYHHRPRACRRVEAGDAECLARRRERGLSS